MNEKTDLSTLKEEARAQRKKSKRIEDSRASIKAKNSEKGKIIKAHQDRQTELEQNRDDWKTKCKEQEKERIHADNKYEQLAALFNMREEELREILKELVDLKKKHPSINPRGKRVD